MELKNLFAKMNTTLSLSFFSLISQTPGEGHSIKASSLASVSQPDFQSVTSHGVRLICKVCLSRSATLIIGPAPLNEATGIG